MKNKLVAPVVKWVGGKRQLMSEIEPLFPKRYTTYCEPFVGGGAVLFSKQPRHAIVNDLNKDLGYISKMVNSGNRINEKIIFLHVNNTEKICNLMHSFLD